MSADIHQSLLAQCSARTEPGGINLHHGDKLSLHSSHFFKLRKRDRGLTYAYWDRGSGDGGDMKEGVEKNSRWLLS